MKHKSITIIAILLLVLFGLFIGSAPIIIAAIVLPASYFIVKLKNRNKPEQTPTEQINLQDLVDTYGKPDDIILANPLHGEQADGVILIYNKRMILIINGIPINQADIISVTFNNATIPYVGNEYQLVFNTKLENASYLFVPVGNDLSYAKEIFMQIKQYLGI